MWFNVEVTNPSNDFESVHDTNLVVLIECLERFPARGTIPDVLSDTAEANEDLVNMQLVPRDVERDIRKSFGE